MLQAKTEEQKDKVEEILSSVELWELDGDDGIFINDSVSFDKLAELTDYLRSVDNPKKNELDMSIVAPQMLEPVEIWLAYKKEKGQSYKPTGFKTFYKNLCKYSNNDHDTAMLIIDLSMQNNYAGIFPLRNNNSNTNGYGRETITDKIRRTVEEANKFSRQLTDRIGNNQQADVCAGDSDEVW